MIPRLLLTASLLLWTAPAAADCIDYTHAPATPPPAEIWDRDGAELRPGAIVIDSTAFDGTQLDDGRLPRPADVDVEGGLLFVAYRGGFQIRDARGANAAAPTLLSSRGLWEGDFPGWTARTAEFRDIFWGIDAPADDPTRFALVGVAPVGFSVWDAADPAAPWPRYVDEGAAWLLNVFTASIGGSTYAFTSDAAALSVYDLDAAERLPETCIDDPGHARNDCGVFVASAPGAGKFMSGMQIGDRTMVVTSAGSYARTASVRLWDVSDPAAPVLVASGVDEASWGVAAWSDRDRGYVAARTEDESGLARLRIYDVTECASGACDFPAAIASVDLAQDPGIPELLRVVSAGRLGDVPVLYTASLWSCVASGLDPVQRQRDYLFDLRDPAAPREATPGATADWLGRNVDYWSWYYTDSLGGGDRQKGFNLVFPGGAAFADGRVYRAYGTLLDVHEWMLPARDRGEGDAGPDGDAGPSGDDARDEVAGDTASAGGCACRADGSDGGGVLWIFFAAGLVVGRRRAQPPGRQTGSPTPASAHE